MNSKPNSLTEIYRTISVNILVPILFIMISGSITWISKLEERIYQLQREAVTETKLSETEQRIMRYMDVRLNDLDNKLQIVIRQLEMVDNQLRSEK